MAPAKAEAKPKTIVYRYKDGVYVNLTNRCPTACRFCIKFTWKMRYRGFDLKLAGEEPSVARVLEALAGAWADKPFAEVVFCGYGESTYRLADMLAVCDEVKRRYPGVRRRLNTIGLGNLINGRSISHELAQGLDAVSISLNTADPAQWLELMQPLREFKTGGFASVKDFIRECSAAVA